MSRGDCMAIACAEAFRGDGGKMVSPMAPFPKLGARLAKATFAPTPCTVVSSLNQACSC